MPESRFGGGVLLGILLALPTGCAYGLHAASDTPPTVEFRTVKVPVISVTHKMENPKTKVVYKAKMPESCLEYNKRLEDIQPILDKAVTYAKKISDESPGSTDKFAAYRLYKSAHGNLYDIFYGTDGLKTYARACQREIDEQKESSK